MKKSSKAPRRKPPAKPPVLRNSGAEGSTVNSQPSTSATLSRNANERLLKIHQTIGAQKFPGVPTVTEAEMFALLAAHKSIEQYQATPFHQPLQMAFQKLAGQLNTK